MLYLDTSLVTSALTSEEATGRTQEWLDTQSVDELFVSDWVITEFSSALSLKLRTGRLDLGQRAGILASFHRMLADNCTVLEVTPPHFRAAAAIADRHTLGIRAGDALHLAIAADHGLTLCTLDRRMAEVGPELGVSARLI